MKRLSYFSGGLVLLIAIGAFALSFAAIRDLSIQNGISPAMAWIVPLIVDGAIIVFSLATLRATLAGDKRTQAMMLIIMYTVLSIILNAAHAKTTPVGILIAVMIPVTLFASFETLMQQIQATMQRGISPLVAKWQRRARWLLKEARRLQVVAIEVQEHANSLQRDLLALQSRTDKLQERANEATALQKQVTKLQKQLNDLQGAETIPQGVGAYGRDLLRLFADSDLTLDEVASRYGMSASQVSRDKSKLNGGVIVKELTK